MSTYEVFSLLFIGGSFLIALRTLPAGFTYMDRNKRK